MNVMQTAISVGLGWAMLAGAASAASLNTSGTWNNSTPAGGISGQGTNQISWGNPATVNGQSSYKFVGVSETVDVADLTASNFLLGEFTHNNFPVFEGNGLLESTTLSVDFSLDAISKLFTFDFDHFETPNDGTPCAAGGAQPCPDLVSFDNGGVSNEFITLDGIDYNLTLIGFSQDGGNTLVEEFLTLENQANTAGLYAQLTQVPTESVPEPASLLGILLVGGAATTLKLKQQQA